MNNAKDGFTAIEVSELVLAEYYFGRSDFSIETYGGCWPHLTETPGRLDRIGFRRILDGYHCTNNTSLPLHRRDDRKKGYQVMFTAPKSVSLLALLTGDKRILTAFSTAVRGTLEFLETFVATRVRKNGADDQRVTGNLAAAIFVHQLTRRGNPHLHAHVLCPNFTYDQVEGQLKALDPLQIGLNFALIVAEFRAKLAYEIELLGYKLCLEEASFEISGVSKEIRDLFSGDFCNGDDFDVDLDSYKLGKKSRALTASKQRKAWQLRAPAKDLETLVALKKEAAAQVMTVEGGIRKALKTLARQGHESKVQDLIVQAARFGLGKYSVRDVTKAVNSGQFDLIIDGDDFTTHEAVDEGRELVEAAKSGSQFEAIGLESPVAELSKEQNDLLACMLGAEQQFIFVDGPAGSGKSSILKHFADRIGKPVTFCAINTPAVRNLKEVASRAVTVAKVMKNRALIPRRGVLVVDEASLVSCRTLRKLIAAAKTKNCRIIFLGDLGQMKPVRGNGGISLLLEEDAIKSFGLREIRRQKEPSYQALVSHFVQKRFREAAEYAIDRNFVGVSEDEESRADMLALEYANAHGRGTTDMSRSVLAVALSWKEARTYTEAIRRRLRAAGHLGDEEVEIATFRPLGVASDDFLEDNIVMSGIYLQTYRRGQGAMIPAEIVGRTATYLSIRGTAGKVSQVKIKKNMALWHRERLHISVGDVLFLRKDCPQLGLANGQFVTVSKIEGEQIFLEGVGALPTDFRYFTHGYCLTAHLAQSLTVGTVLAAMDDKSARYITREWLYVAITRGAHYCRVFVESLSGFRHAALRSGHRRSALDVARRYIDRVTAAHRGNPVVGAAELEFSGS